ncbi:MAG: 1-deoxy-D-xylulose-5-phosphate synthase [Chlamydiia bacterium]|nr:1-deoxy-D-xylulose-5-phosphate synthase [Chlamydiia bacterium]
MTSSTISASAKGIQFSLSCDIYQHLSDQVDEMERWLEGPSLVRGLLEGDLCPEQLTCVSIYISVLIARQIDDKTITLSKQNKGGTFQLCTKGHEIVGLLSGLLLTSEKDWGFPYYRDRAFAIGLGSDLVEVIASCIARDCPRFSGGRCMPDHFSDDVLRMPIQSSCVGSQILQAVGVAKGIALRGANEVVYVSAGDGATSQGDFHEALNFSSIHKLPIIFVIQDNEWAISTPKYEQTSGGSIFNMCQGYADLLVEEVDGTDFVAYGNAFAKGVERCRRQERPMVLIAKVPRIGPHSSSDNAALYKSALDVEDDLSRDPVVRMSHYMMETLGWKREFVDALFAEVIEYVNALSEAAEKIPFPDPATVEEHLFKKGDEVIASDGVLEGNEIVMVDALNHALAEEMERDEGVVVFGQDVAHNKGGVFGVSKHLTDRFGGDRCFNTPLAESTIIGLAIGLSITGEFRPVAEIQFADYIWTGINQIFNELASYHYRSNGMWNCPVVLRMPCGGYIQGGPYHSQSIEAFLAHCPGLYVVMPSCASDAKRLLKSAIRNPNPVVFLEHKALYRSRYFSARKEPDEKAVLPLGQAEVVLEGESITLITWSYMTALSHEVCVSLAKEGVDVELIDLRTICPLDFETIARSVKKTGKVLIVHEASLTCGFGAEIAARISEELFDYLDAPIRRIGGKNVPTPYCKVLENHVLVQREDIERALISLNAY